MNAGEALVAAVRAALADAALPVFDAPPVRAGLPHAVIDEPQFGAADAAGVSGRAGTLAIGIHDDGERPIALRAHVADVEMRIAALPSALGGGWRIGGLVLSRSRLARIKAGWTARLEWSVRMFREN